jgi:hypothetical protein
VTWAELPRSPGHAFHDKLQAVLRGSDFDGFVEGRCAPFHAPGRGRPSLPPGPTWPSDREAVRNGHGYRTNYELDGIVNSFQGGMTICKQGSPQTELSAVFISAPPCG